MRWQEKNISNFGKNTQHTSACFRPETLDEIINISHRYHNEGLLVHGNGLSYNDSCLYDQGKIILSERLNHFIEFDERTGLVICEPGIPIRDLFSLSPRWSPAVVPGSSFVSIGGAIAHDVHGKNQVHEGCFSDHIAWIELLTGESSRRISPKEHPDLWKATVGGLGLTGIITAVALQLKEQPHFVTEHCQRFNSLQDLLETMKDGELDYPYQAAWLNGLNGEQSILCHASPLSTNDINRYMESKRFSVPSCPVALVNRWSLSAFNRLFYYMSNKASCQKHFLQFNNPLDRIHNWPNLYGPKGLVQIQCLFPFTNALQTLKDLQSLIVKNRAIPCLTVLKCFQRSGQGYLSFAKAGMTIAIDFKNQPSSHKAIADINQLMIEQGGTVYLAKDIALNQQQFETMYPEHARFKEVLQRYQSPMRSALGKRLGIHT